MASLTISSNSFLYYVDKKEWPFFTWKQALGWFPFIPRAGIEIIFSITYMNSRLVFNPAVRKRIQKKENESN